MSDTGITDDFMSKFTMPSLTVMGGHMDSVSETQTISSNTSSPRVRHVTHTHRKYSYREDPMIGWTHNFDSYHRPGRKASETLHNRGPMTSLTAMGGSNDLYNSPQSNQGGFFQKIKDALHF